MAREKAVIEKDWKATEKTLETEIKSCNQAPDLDEFDERLERLHKPWAAWQKVCDEAVKKVNDKDWKDDKKLPADRAAFKKWVVAQSTKKRGELEKLVLGIQTRYANMVKLNKDLDLKIKTLRGEFTKSNGVYAKDRDGQAALERTEKITDQMMPLLGTKGIKKTVFEFGREFMKLLSDQIKTLEKAQADQVKFAGDINKITYDTIRKDIKMFQAYCQMVKQPAHFEFMKATDFGKKGDKAIYDKFIKTNSVNVIAALVEEFAAIAATEKPDWAKAPWLKVAGEIDGMLRDQRHVDNYKKQLMAARRP